MSGHFLVVDSGVGGLSVARALRGQDDRAHITYVADDDGFPYGEKPAEELTAHVVALVRRLVDGLKPDVAVIACNTASTLVLPPLRREIETPVVGTVPAIKPAAEQTRSGVISVLATPGTIERDYTRDLIAQHAPDRHVRLVGSYELAPIAERAMRGEPVSDEVVRAEIAPAFTEVDGRRVDTVVLGCTHYVFLAEVLNRVAPWPVRWIDAAPAIARRALSLAPSGAASGGGAAVLTSGARWPTALQPLINSLGLAT